MSNSQKYIKMVSILNVISGAAYVVFALLAVLGVGLAGDAMSQMEGAPSNAAIAAFIGSLLVSGAITLVSGILGLGAAKDASKIKPVFTLSLIGFVITLLNVILGAVGNNLDIGQIMELVAPALMLWCSYNVKKEAGV
ncbi:MAG: hypothetical protein IK151_03000 [Erysipelotrichaceae bacterium]|nr:hypothetical protein [Erysipelotrichaceae bacterium]